MRFNIPVMGCEVGLGLDERLEVHPALAGKREEWVRGVLLPA